jgi:hypothetical protein
MTITRKIVLDEKGEPTEVIIPYGQFVEMMEVFGLDLGKSDQDELRESLNDSRDKRRENFMSASEI